MRVRFLRDTQQSFLETVERATGREPQTLATAVGVCARTYRDWRRGKWQMSAQHLDRLCQLAGVPRPHGIELLPEHWSVEKAARLGGLRHLALYGAPGTLESRRKGGQTAQRLFRLRPEWYRARGVSLRKSIKVPEYSEALAELVGILLGDGGIHSYQVIVSLNKRDEADYLMFVARLIRRLFGLQGARAPDKKENSVNLVVSSVALVEWLERMGMRKGNKVAQQVDIPRWIWKCEAYQRGCLRGLMDTDGCFHRHRYQVNGQFYSYPKMCFVSYSKPLFESARKLFASLGLAPTPHKDGQRLYLHDATAVIRYMKIVGTHNSHHRRRFTEHTNSIGRN